MVIVACPRIGDDANAIAVGQPQDLGVDGRDSQCILPGAFAPRLVTDDGVGRERTTLAVRQ